jgi:putative pyruvate formate lyase activating enzyme
VAFTGPTCVLHAQVAEAIAAAVDKGLDLPIVYNTSSYDGLSSLALMDGLVDM